MVLNVVGSSPTRHPKILSSELLYGVMVAREILVLLVWVRALVQQQGGEIE